MDIPEFSVIIPTFNRPEQLSACLDSLSRSELTSFEVVVVDDGGTSDLAPTLMRYRDRMQLALLRQANAGPSAARNLGVEHARGRFVAFTDDDCRPTPGWLAALGRAARRNPDCLIGGPIVNGNSGNYCSAASQAILDTVYRHKNSEPADARFLVTANVAAAADCFRSIGGFDVGFRTSEDREFCDRWLAAGRRIIYVPDAVVSHESRRRLAGFVRQHYDYGAGAYRYHRLRAACGRSSAGFERWTFYRCLVTDPLKHGRVPGALLVAGLVALSQVASAFGYIGGAVRARRSCVAGG